jgi:methylenetetrahydrofolate reductase (NADPH)
VLSAGSNVWQACEGGLERSIDLVRLIKQEHGDYFGIAVGGYPEGHSQGSDRKQEIRFLKEKVEAGADFVLTQFFYDADLFLGFVNDCQAAGISCPIIPGIMPIQNYNAFVRMNAHCGTQVPREIMQELEQIKDDQEAVKNYGVALGAEMGKKLLDSGLVGGLHFYTLNLERSIRLILEQLGLDQDHNQALPWRPSTLAKREHEDVRPIYWANRPKSYLDRTDSWDKFPTGRWADESTPKFEELGDQHYMSSCGNILDRKTMWGDTLLVDKEVFEVFERYICGEISRLPWCESALHLETLPIKAQLARINRNGFLTINSQPRVNGLPSSDSSFGWGGPGGYVYQKAYVECFCSPANLRALMSVLEERSSCMYFASDVNGNTYSKWPGMEAGRAKWKSCATAISWGVFPNKEILQPTIADPVAFMAWKDEAFALWLSVWAGIYDDESEAKRVLYDIHNAYFLVSIVDNDFVNGDIWSIFDEATARISPES